MIGVWAPHAQTFLLVLAAVTTAVFALPIFAAPLTWARWFTWTLPEHTDLAVYFGRCLGAFALIVEALIARAGWTGEGIVLVFEILVMVAGMMVLVHVWGALQRIQPVVETLEIGMYSGMLLAALAFYPIPA